MASEKVKLFYFTFQNRDILSTSRELFVASLEGLLIDDSLQMGVFTFFLEIFSDWMKVTEWQSSRDSLDQVLGNELRKQRQRGS